MRGRVRGRFASAVALAILTWAASIAQAQARSKFDLPSQPLADSLRAVGSQANVNVLFDPPLVADHQAPALKGEFTTPQAFTLLLMGTDITHEFMNERTVLLAAAPPTSLRGMEKGEPAEPSSRRSVSDNPSLQGEVTGEDSKKGFWQRFRLAQADSSSAQVASRSADATPSVDKPGTIAEVIVTAQKRSERLLDVPVPVTAISGDTLVNSNQLRIQDYYTRIPGLNFSPSGQVVQLLSIRGLTTGPGNPTVAVTVDDMPYGTATNNGGGLAVPDIDPGDLARVEVLRGPQGTLYGANSLGGLLKFVTVDPSMDRVSGRVQMGLSSVKNGDEAGYNVRGSVNVPLSDTFAVRASAFTRLDPGYIDNIETGREGVNEQRVSGGLLSALWRASETFSLKLTALYQDTDVEGSSDVNGTLGDLQQSYIRGTGDFDLKAQAYSATLTGILGSADLTAVSGYSINEFTGTTDAGEDFNFATGPVFGDAAGDLILDDSKAEKFSQEIRLSMPVGENVQWLLGAFYTHEDTEWVETLHAVDTDTGAMLTPEWGSISFPSTYSEIAAFTDLTFHINDQFDVQVGGRQSRIRQASTETNGGDLYTGVVLFPPQANPYILPEERVEDNAFTYLVTPRFKLSPDLMVYARLASGYRTGGTNLPPGVPRTYDPDTTQNYELGFKGDFLDHRLSLDASLYYIDWKDIQLSLFDLTTFQVYKANASSARSQGVELSMESKPINGLTLAAWVVWNDAELTADFPPGAGQGSSGDELPYSSHFSGNFSLDCDVSLTDRMTGFFGATVSYVGDRKGVFRNAFAPPNSERQEYPAYAETDLRAGVRHDDWTVNLFVNNATDKRVALTGGLGGFPAFAFKYNQPRTIGVSLVKTF